MNVRNDSGRGAIAVKKQASADTGPREEAAEARQEQPSTEESYDSEEDFRLSDISRVEEEGSEKQME